MWGEKAGSICRETQTGGFFSFVSLPHITERMMTNENIADG
jgi:hypothetical protein